MLVRRSPTPTILPNLSIQGGIGGVFIEAIKSASLVGKRLKMEPSETLALRAISAVEAFTPSFVKASLAAAKICSSVIFLGLAIVNEYILTNSKCQEVWFKFLNIFLIKERVLS